MSKQSDAKKSQGYVSKVIPATCSNCEHFQSNKEEVPAAFGGTYLSESNLRCAIGGFKVNKNGWCWGHKTKENP